MTARPTQPCRRPALASLAVTPDSDAAPPENPDGISRRQVRNQAVASNLANPIDDGVGDTLTDEDVAAAREARLLAKPQGPKTATRNAIEWVAVVTGAIIIAVIVRTFIFQTFWIPSPSMAETLVHNDRVLVNKLAYRFHDVNRGDVVVFERPPNQEGDIKDLIKRVIALPGERVSIIDGTVRINGKVLEEPYTNGLITEAKVGCGLGDTKGIDTEAGLKIAENHLLVLGDNRTNSQDGRCFGPIDEDLLVGRAFFIMWPPSKAGGL